MPSLKTRLQLGLGAIAVAIGLLSIAAVLSLDRLGGAIATILRENYVSVVACEDMKEALERIDSAAQFSSTGHEDIGRPMLARHREAFAKAFAAEAANITLPGEGELVRELDALFGDYARAVDATLAQAPDARSEIYFRDLLPRFVAIKDRVQAILRMNQSNMEAADFAAKELSARTSRIAIGVGLAAVLFATWLAWRLPRALVRPLERFTAAANLVGEGRFDVTIADPGMSELAPLARGFSSMLERLRAYRESSLGELLAAKDLARATLECLLDPVVVFQDDGAILLANDAAEEAFGFRAGSAEEIKRAAIVVPDAIASARDEVFENGGPVLPRALAEAMRGPREGGERYYLVRAAKLSAAKSPSAIVIAQDVTRFRRIDELKSDMVATVSHELKTPLTSLRMATHLLLEPGTGELTEAQLELVTTARADTERLRTMVEDLLSVVRIERDAGELHPIAIDPRALFAEVVEAHRTLARDKGVELVIGPSPAELRAPLDVERMSIALANLVSNAIRHTPSGGRVELQARAVGDELTLSVKDEGEGIRDEDIARVLGGNKPGPRDGAGSRHGLGLLIAREIVTRHGGELRFARREGGGSELSIALPLSMKNP